MNEAVAASAAPSGAHRAACARASPSMGVNDSARGFRRGRWSLSAPKVAAAAAAAQANAACAAARRATGTRKGEQLT